MRWVYFDDAAWQDSLQLDTQGTGDAWVHDPACRTDEEGTLLFWFAMKQLENSRMLFTMSSQHNPGSNSYIYIDLITAQYRPRIVRRLATTGGSETAYASAVYLDADERYHLAITSEMKMYVNGALAATVGSIGPGWFADMSATQWRMCFGGYRTGSGSGSRPDCLLNEPLIVNRVLNATEVAEAYDGGNTKDPATFSFAADIVHGYGFEGDLTDSFGSAHLSTSGTIAYAPA